MKTSSNAHAAKAATKRPAFRVTFDIITEESARHGDTASNGFLDAQGWQYAQQDFATWEEWQAFEAPEMTLKEAVNLCGSLENSGHWLTENDTCIDSDGREMIRSIHPPRNISSASYARLCRALGL